MKWNWSNTLNDNNSSKDETMTWVCNFLVKHFMIFIFLLSSVDKISSLKHEDERAAYLFCKIQVTPFCRHCLTPNYSGMYCSNFKMIYRCQRCRACHKMIWKQDFLLHFTYAKFRRVSKININFADTTLCLLIPWFLTPVTSDKQILPTVKLTTKLMIRAGGW